MSVSCSLLSKPLPLPTEDYSTISPSNVKCQCPDVTCKSTVHLHVAKVSVLDSTIFDQEQGNHLHVAHTTLRRHQLNYSIYL